MSRSRVVAGTGEMEALGRELGARLRAGDLVVLTGPLGAGKTTLTRGIGEALHVRGPITSPTFVLARTHPPLAGGPALVHVDAYRVGSAMELDDLDIDYDSSVVVAEWGQGLIESETDSWLEVVIVRPEGAGGDFDPSDAPEEPRTVTITGHGPRWADGAWAERAWAENAWAENAWAERANETAGDQTAAGTA